MCLCQGDSQWQVTESSAPVTAAAACNLSDEERVHGKPDFACGAPKAPCASVSSSVKQAGLAVVFDDSDR